MAVPSASVNFGDLLDPRFQEIWDSEYPQPEDKIETLYRKVASNGRDTMKFSSVGTMPNFEPFTGTVTYQGQAQGYDTTLTPLEFTSGFQVERRLFDDDQYHIMDQKPRGLKAAAMRTRQGHAARLFNFAFLNDTYFYNNTEGVALCSDSHTTTSGASTTTGFDNNITGALTAVSVATAFKQFQGFRGDQAEILQPNPDTLLYHYDNYEQAYEIIMSGGKLDTANNNPNVHQGRYKGMAWNYLSSSTNWFMMDSELTKEFFIWTDRMPLEFGSAEEFDTFIAKWRSYMRYGLCWTNWRGIIGLKLNLFPFSWSHQCTRAHR